VSNDSPLGPLERFLEEKAEPGRFDSQGHFSISAQRALEKLIDHAVADPAHWILKLVQAGVAARAEEIQIKAFRGSTRADIVLATLPPLDKLEGALLRLESPRGSLLAELCIGLRALLKQHQFRLIWCDGESAQGFVWNGSSLDFVKAHACSVPSSRLRLEMSGPQTSAASRADEARLLEQLCRWCCVTLVLDGRQVNGPGNLPQSQFPHLRHGVGSPRYLASGWLGDHRNDSVCQAVTNGQEVMRTETPFLHWARKPGHQFGGGFCFYVSYEYLTGALEDLLHLPGHHSPFLISEFFCLGVNRLGVLCGGYESEDFGLGGELVVCGDFLTTDLVGLTVEPDERWHQDLSKVLEELAILVDIVKDRLVVHGRRARPGMWEQARDIDFGLVARRVLVAIGVCYGTLPGDAVPDGSNDVARRGHKDNPRVLQKLPDWLAENFRRLAASPPPRYWRRLNLPMGGV
jgi:hypothetical protein